MTRTFVAPGKVVVAGEYAVVDGAPAIVAAVDLGVAVDVAPAPVASVHTPHGDSRFVDAALAATAAPPARWVFRDHGGAHLPSKPGLGGSAAATVVAVHAARALADEDLAPQAVFAVADPVHRAVQGSGSGIDVAASTWGGTLRFRRGEVPRPVTDLPLVVVWTGHSAQTGPRVERYQAWSGRSAFVAASTALVEGFDADPMAALREDGALLVAMAAEAGIAYRTPELDRIVALATAHGGAAKPSGAGGGDCAVALLPDAEATAAFVAACTADGLVVLATRTAPGVHEEDAATLDPQGARR